MIRNYIKIAARNLWKFKGYSLINVLGLAIGMACVILIMLYVQRELSYDGFHAKSERIYRLNIQTTSPNSGETNERAIGPFRMADELKPDFPDFENIVRIAPENEEITVEDQQYVENNLAFVDPEIFSVFDFQLIEGDPQKALIDPFSMVITPEIASKYFGSTSAIGKTVVMRDEEFLVTGILEPISGNSQFDFNVLVSMNCSKQVFGRIVLENWGEGYVETFVLVDTEKTPESFESRLASFADKKLEAWKAFSPRIAMQPLSKLYLHSQEISTFAAGGDITYVYAFSFIALFILIIACINFMNLATARSSLRAREVGLRKVVGAERSQLIYQFLSESTLLSIFSLIIAIGLVYLVIPSFNNLADSQISLNIGSNKSLLATLLLITAFVGIVAGSYPAFLLSGFKPIQILSGRLNFNAGSSTFRRVLVAFQFAISIFLVGVTAIVYQQLDYCKNMKLGYDKEQILLIQGTPIEMRGKYEQFTSELMSNPQIINAGGSSRVPPGSLSSSLNARPEGVPEDQQRGMQTVWTDFGFIETMGFEMVAGRSFSREYSSDASTGFILNESAVDAIGWTNETAIGKSFGSSEISDWEQGQWEDRDGQVIGVLKDAHFESLKDKIVPTVYFIAPYMAWNYAVKLRSDNIPATIQFITQKWESFNPEASFDYTFVDENFDSLYENEERQGTIFSVFALLAIFIACLGLVGLVSFTAVQKRKEVGIRKVLGASIGSIVMLFSKEFIWLILIAFLVATPVAWYIMTNWLQEFAYHINIGIGVFVFAGLIALAIAWITIGIQTGKAAMVNPVNSLKM